MKILALDTSSAACSVAFLHDDKIKTRHEVIPLQHAHHLLSFIEDILGPHLYHLDALAWGCGPGSFTGLRIAASVVQAFGFSNNIPIMSVSSLAALAQTAFQEHGWERLLVAIDARMNEIYWASYCINTQGYAELMGEEQLQTPSDIIPKVKLLPKTMKEWYGVGDAWSEYRNEMQNCLKNELKDIDANCLPKALAVAQLGRLKYEKGEGLRYFDALPRYLRDNVCKDS